MEPKSRLTPEQREAVARRLQLRRTRTTTVPTPSAGEGPASFANERLWFLEQLAPGLPTYVEHVALRLRGPVDLGRLAAAVHALHDRHPALRTSFHLEDGQLRQRVAMTVAPSVGTRSLTSLPAPDRESALLELARTEARRTFDLTVAPLARFTVVEVGPEDHALLLVNHHLISDGWSRNLLVRDVAREYLGDPTPPPNLSPLDVAAQERSRFAHGAFDAELSDWRESLSGLGPMDLPSDRPRPAVRSGRGASMRFRWNPEQVRGIEGVARRAGATLFAGLLAAFDVWLHQLTDRTDLAVATPVAGRGRPELESVVGCFVNTVIVRCSLAGDPTFVEVVGRVRDRLHQALNCASVPFDRVVAAVAPTRDPSRPPLAQVMFTLLPASDAHRLLPDLRVEPQQVDVGVSRLDLTVELTPTPDTGLDGRVEFDTDLFDPATVARWMEQLTFVLTEVAAAPDTRLSALSRISPADSAAITRWERPARPVDVGDDVFARFTAAADRWPDRIALTGDGRERTYRELRDRVHHLAGALRARGIGPGARVGVCVRHGPMLVEVLWAVLGSGAAYVPLDPSHPARRLALVLDDAAPDLVVVDTVRDLGSVAQVTVAELDRGAGGPLSDTEPQSPAYVLYTSGSTGRPKGVEVTRRNLASFFSAMDDLLGHPEDGRWLALTSYAFDISVLELLWPLTRGMRVVAPDADEVAAAERRVARAVRPPIDLGLFFFAAAQGDGYRLLLESARFADRHGFTAVWTPERHFHTFGAPYPNPAVIGAAVAAVTQNVGIRAGSVVAPLHHPLRVAEEWAVVDVLSGGRAGIAFASGWHADDFVFAPGHYAERRDHLERCMDTVRRLWRGQAVHAENGTGRTIEVHALPRPVSSELPVWVTSSGDPATFERAGALGAGVLTHLLGQDLPELAEKIARYRAAWRAAGHPGEGRVVLMLHTFLGDDLDRVKSQVRGPFCTYLRSALGLIRNLADALGLDMDSPQFTADDLDALLEHAFERYFGTGALLGTVESCAPLVARLRNLGVDELACLVDFGLPTDAVLGSLPLVDQLRRESAAAPPSDPIGELVAHHGITHFQCTPTAARELVARCGPALAQLERWLVGGEELPLELGRAMAATGAAVTNVYGPTEATVWASSARVDARDSRVTIGRPIGNTRLHVVDAGGRRMPIGQVGELWIGGDGVARGYRGLPDLTRERFVPDRFDERPGGQLYRTGDLARWLPDGELQFLGRTDRQIKLRGFRIELGDIEAALLRHPQVRDTVADVRGDAADLRIVAWIVGRFGAEVDPDSLRDHLRRELPPYMIPSRFVSIDAVPRNPSGKTDRTALPAPPTSRESRSAFVAADTALERAVVELWRDLLGVDRVGLDDDFFELGGHSLLAIQLVARLRTQLDLALPLRAFMERPTVAGCVAWRATEERA